MNYKVGTDDPKLWRDTGAGVWNSVPMSPVMHAQKLLMSTQIGAVALAIGRHAAANLNHYLGNTGESVTIDLANMVKSSESGQAVFDNELNEAKQFAEALGPGDWNITSSQTSPGDNALDQTKDWFYAVGGYQAWGKASVTVPPISARPRNFCMDFEYCFFQQYNWNKGIGVNIGPIRVTDKFMSDFHLQGLAREYEMRGSYHVIVQWQPGVKPATQRDMSQLAMATGEGLWH